VDAQLNVKDSKLCVTGGAVLVGEDCDEDDSYWSEYVRMIDVTPGLYHAALYSQVPGVNGSAPLDHIAGDYRAGEPLGAWFRRTRPDEAFPEWLRYLCVAYPDADPGHEAGLQEIELPDPPEQVHFVAHLTPDESVEKDGLTELPARGRLVRHRGERAQAGAVSTRHRRARRDRASRRGIWRLDVWHREREGLCDARTRRGRWRYGGARGRGCVARAAAPMVQLAHDGARAARVADADVAIEGTVAVREGDTVRFVFGDDRRPSQQIPVIEELGATLSQFPDGTVLELCSAPPGDLG
jgi:hypothetical protein